MEPTMPRHVIMMTLDDAAHYTRAQRQAIIDGYEDHEREARTQGRPALGSGLVFPVADAQIVCEPQPIPDHWPRIIGLDFGWEHPFGAVALAWDRDADVIYVTADYVQAKQTPVIHAAAIRPWGEWIPCAWPHDGLQHDKGSGAALAGQYAAQGLNMLAEHATHEQGGFGTEAGVTDMLDRMQTGRFKVFSNCTDWLVEKRNYHRKGGLIVKERDDLMSATRIGVMMRRFAIVKPVRRARRASGADGGWMGA
jgi:hypothetical protein